MTKAILHKRGEESALPNAVLQPSELVYTTDSEKLYYAGNNRNAILIAKHSDVSTVAQAVVEHSANKNNPHEVTKEQVGLGNVSNFAIATEEEALAGTATDKYVTVATAQKMIEKAITALKAELTEIIG